MSNIVRGDFGQFGQFTQRNPEHATLLQLSEKHAIRTVHFEHTENAAETMIAYFTDGLWMHFYQRGFGHLSDHLWFWSWATKLPINNVQKSIQDMLGDQWQKSGM